MTIGLVGRKCGMTRVFNDLGESIPVSVVEVEPNIITQLKTNEIDGYPAIQVTMGKRRITRVTKPLVGHYKKAGVAPGLGLWEFRIESNQNSIGDTELKVGSELTVKLFSEGQIVDVKGTTKGKGFAGVIKRHHFSHQDYTHGNSLSHRVPGSIGQNQTPGRVFKGKKMSGHLGDVPRTIQNLSIVKIDLERNLLLVKGAIPGAPGGIVIVSPAKKQQRAKGEK